MDVGFLESQWESGEVMDSFTFGLEGKDLICLKSEDTLSVCIRDVCDRFLVWEAIWKASSTFLEMTGYSSIRFHSTSYVYIDL